MKKMLKKPKVDLIGELATPKQSAQWQHKNYCQICYNAFNRVTLTPHHCRKCGRTCCKDCSVKRLLPVDQISEEKDLGASTHSLMEDMRETRICEYCEVQLDNPQIEMFYQCGKNWRMREHDTIQRKLDWYTQSQHDLENHIKTENEKLTMAEMDYHSQKTILNNKIDTVMSDKIRIDNLKKNIIMQVNQKIIENQDMDEKIDDLQKKRTQMLIELDKAMALFERKEQERVELVKKIQIQ